MPVILKVAVPFPLRQTFDYLPPEEFDLARLRPGCRLQIPFGRRNAVGILLEIAPDAGRGAMPLKRVRAVLDDAPLLAAVDCQLLHWASDYYHHPVGEVFQSAFPVRLRQGHAALIDEQLGLCLTDIGAVESPSAQRASAVRQAQLLDWLRLQPDGISKQELQSLSWDWRPVVRVLLRKNWACWRPLMPSANIPAIPVRDSPPKLNAAQQVAVDSLGKVLGRFGCFLLEGVTGSGKTEVYLRLVEKVLARGEQVMLLLPEIGLTPQLESRFRARFPASVALFHSGLAESERCRAWLEVQQGRTAILLGTRSAVFTPMSRPGLIILDEEHDTSFKQQEGFRFSARDVAIMRARLLEIPVLLGSATPSLETLHNVQRGRYVRLALPERAGVAQTPVCRLLDIRNQRLLEGLSPRLVTRMEEVLGRGEQILLFLNRRGYAPTLICHGCGWVATCKRCDARLVVHAGNQRLCCHHCGHEQTLVKSCPACTAAALRPLGLGTERVERALQKLFPKYVVLRVDRDSTRRKGSLEGILAQAHHGEGQILLGTQMLAKGHHFPRVTLVGILDVDAGLFSTDFRASERTAQLIVQVAGRAGRADRPGEVLLQTRQPDHPLLRYLIRDGYSSFAAAALEERKLAGLPPYTHQALWRAEANQAETPLQVLEAIREHVGSRAAIQMLGPAPAPMQRRAGRHRFQLLWQSSQRKPLHGMIEDTILFLGNLAEAGRVRWSVDIDPIDLS